jgi:hypothetical protein
MGAVPTMGPPLIYPRGSQLALGNKPPDGLEHEEKAYRCRPSQKYRKNIVPLHGLTLIRQCFFLYRTVQVTELGIGTGLTFALASVPGGSLTSGHWFSPSSRVSEQYYVKKDRRVHPGLGAKGVGRSSETS